MQFFFDHPFPFIAGNKFPVIPYVNDAIIYQDFQMVHQIVAKAPIFPGIANEGLDHLDILIDGS